MSSSHREIGEPGTSVPLARENEAFEMDVEADYNIAPPSYDEVRKQKVHLQIGLLRHSFFFSSIVCVFITRVMHSSSPTGYKQHSLPDCSLCHPSLMWKW